VEMEVRVGQRCRMVTRQVNWSDRLAVSVYEVFRGIYESIRRLYDLRFVT